MIERIVVDALQVAATPTGVGAQARSLGEQLGTLGCPYALEVRCPAATRALLEPSYPKGTVFHTPIAESKPRWRRLVAQQLVGPLRDPRTTLVVGLGDQGPLWGRARVCLVVNDLRRLALPTSAGRAERRFYRLVTPRAARHAAAVLTISAFSQAEIGRLLGVSATVIAQSPPPVGATDAGGSPDGHLLALGALRRYKGLATAVEALALLPAGARRRLLIVGPDEDGRERLELQRLAERKGVGDLVHLAGWLPEPALAAVRRGAVATVSPSTYEGYGLAVAESLAWGLPTIAADIPAHREIAGDAALLFAPGDAAALAACIGAAVDRRQELAAAALARSHELQAAGASFGEAVLAVAARS